VTTLYGISNCDKCRKALKWFAHQDIDVTFHDLRKDGLNASMARRWLALCDADELLNRRSTTWRNLTQADRVMADDDAVIKLLLDHPTLVKRPLIENGSTLIVGYDDQAWRETLI